MLSEKFVKEMENKLNLCPKCGKRPRVIIDYGYEALGWGGWVTIQCKPILRKPHEKVEVGKSTNKRALEIAVTLWNDVTENMES